METGGLWPRSTSEESDVADVKDVLERATTVAVVGCSTDPGKAAHRIPAELQEAGYTVFPVHPSADEILGVRAYRSLADIEQHVDLVDVFRPQEEAPDIARQAVEIGADALWLQLGIRSEEARAIAEEAGLDYIQDRCAGAERRRLGITKG